MVESARELSTVETTSGHADGPTPTPDQARAALDAVRHGEEQTWLLPLRPVPVWERVAAAVLAGATGAAVSYAAGAHLTSSVLAPILVVLIALSVVSRRRPGRTRLQRRDMPATLRRVLLSVPLFCLVLAAAVLVLDRTLWADWPYHWLRVGGLFAMLPPIGLGLIARCYRRAYQQWLAERG